MPGPTQPGFQFYKPEQMPNMSEEDALKSEEGYYGPPRRPPPPLDMIPTDMWGSGKGPIDLSQPPMGDPGAMSARQYERPAGKWFVDQVEDGIARVEDPEGNARTMRAQPGWKEGMHINAPFPPTVHMPDRGPYETDADRHARTGVRDPDPYDEGPPELGPYATPREREAYVRRSRKRRAVP